MSHSPSFWDSYSRQTTCVGTQWLLLQTPDKINVHLQCRVRLSSVQTHCTIPSFCACCHGLKKSLITCSSGAGVGEHEPTLTSPLSSVLKKRYLEVCSDHSLVFFSLLVVNRKAHMPFLQVWIILQIPVWTLMLLRVTDEFGLWGEYNLFKSNTHSAEYQWSLSILSEVNTITNRLNTDKQHFHTFKALSRM